MVTRTTLKKPFEGLRVADFAWVGVGPLVSKYLSDHGAEVIRVESGTYPEALRRAPPFVNDQPGVDNSGYFANFNSSKYGITLNLKHPRARELVKRLVARCDVVTESFTPGTMERFGIGYDELKAVRPDLLMISMPLYGQSGPWARFAGYGHVLQAAAGFNHLTGWPDAEPIGTGIAYTDFLVPHIGAIALIAALDHRRRTGEGQYIDFSQFEAAIHALGTTVLEWTANGHEAIRMGNRDPEAAPHGCYRCKDGRYVVISCFTEKEWEGFRAALGRPDWCDLERMRRSWQRLNEQKEIDRHLGFWCAELSANQVMKLMQENGVPSGIVKSPEDLRRDPQLRHRKHYWTLRHPAMGERTYDGPAFKLSKTPTELTKAAPLLGEDNERVYKEILGIGDDEYATLLIDGALE
jgi:benzylsuccinate CoA-transferase BbsF subunit